MIEFFGVSCLGHNDSALSKAAEQNLPDTFLFENRKIFVQSARKLSCVWNLDSKGRSSR